MLLNFELNSTGWALVSHGLLLWALKLTLVLANDSEFLEQLANQEYSSAKWKQSEKLLYNLHMRLTATWKQKNIVTY